MTNEILQRPRGTRDFTPEEMEIRRYVEKIFREVFESYGFSEIMTPTFEKAELFIRKSGEEVLEEMYFFEDKSGRKMVLRPELTLPTMRFYYSELKVRQKPLKLYYIGNVFRYEEPQKGRYREFWQAGCEIIEGDPERTLLEGLDIIREILKRFGILEKTIIRVGNISIVRKILDKLGLKDNRFIIRAIDKDDIKSIEQKTNRDQLKVIKAIVENNFSQIEELIPEISKDLGEYLSKIQKINEVGIKAEPDLGITRGWDYYEDYVFEVDAPWLGAEKQICGGGFYDLSDVFSERRVVSFGFAFGFDRLIDALREINMLPKIPKKPKVYIAPLSNKAFYTALVLGRRIREQGIICNIDTKGRNMRRSLEYALSNHFDIMIIIGDKELEKGVVSVKDLRENTQIEVPLTNVIEYVISMLGV